MMSETVKIGLIGAGLIGREHAKYCQSSSEVELVGIADPSTAAAELAQILDVAHYADYKEMLQRSDIQAVIAAVPNALHASVAVDALECGLPVLVEKPLADSLDAARQIVEATRQTGVPVLVGHQRRYAPDVAAARKFIASGGVGDVVSVGILSTWRKHDEYFEVSWRTQRGAGPVLINLIHDIDAIRFLVGEIEETISMGGKAVRGLDVPDTTGTVMRFANGAIGTALASDAAASPWCWDLTSGYGAYFPAPPDGDVYFISGTEAAISLPSLTVSRHQGDRHWQTPIEQTTLPRVEVNPYVAQLEHFAAVVRLETEPLITAEDALKTLEVALTIDEDANDSLTRKVFS